MGRRGLSFAGLVMLAASLVLAAPMVAFATEGGIEPTISFCGGGDDGPDDGSSLLYEIEQKLEIGEVEQARRMLVAGMQRGTFHGQARGLAFGVWAESELRLGHFRRATRLYRRAIRAQDVGATDPLQVGLAVALYRGRHAAQARTIAEGFVAEACPEGAIDDPVACYGARLVLAMTAPSADAQAEGMRTADAVRTAEPRLEDSFAHMRGFFPNPPVQLAEVEIVAPEPSTTVPAVTTATIVQAGAAGSREAPRSAVAAR